MIEVAAGEGSEGASLLRTSKLADFHIVLRHLPLEYLHLLDDVNVRDGAHRGDGIKHLQPNKLTSELDTKLERLRRANHRID